MLILTRRPTECVMIGDDIVIRIIEVRGNQVRLGVEAPKFVAVHREEIYERIKREGVVKRSDPDASHSATAQKALTED